jgi:hemerythrin-like domain-containing protein
VKATEILMQEHRLIEQVLDCLEDAARRLDDGERIEPQFFIDAAEFVAGFADGSHHRKEEDILFAALTARDMPADAGPVAVMMYEHEEGRRYTAGFRTAAESLKNGDTGAATDVVRNALDYVYLLREHIMKEDRVLFPMADQLLSGDDMQDVSRKFERVVAEDEENGQIARYKALADQLAAALQTVSTA